MSKLHSDTVSILVNETGPKEFRTSLPAARMAVSGAGTLKSWTGNDWDAGVAFTESQTINPAGRYQITLDAAGYASVQEG